MLHIIIKHPNQTTVIMKKTYVTFSYPFLFDLFIPSFVYMYLLYLLHALFFVRLFICFSYLYNCFPINYHLLLADMYYSS